MNKVLGPLQNLYSDRSGITGLETAIILIAFIVVAAVFAFTVMTTGLFSTEKAKTTAQAGITEASSTFAPKGAIVAQATALGTNNARVQTLFVQLQPATGSAGASINRSDLAFIYVDKNQRYATDGIITDTYDAGPPVVLDETNHGVISGINIRKIVGDAALPNLLQEGEVAEITISLNDSAAQIAVNAPQIPNAIPEKFRLASNTEFSIEIIPSTGGSLIISRKTPPELTSTMNLQ